MTLVFYTLREIFVKNSFIKENRLYLLSAGEDVKISSIRQFFVKIASHMLKPLGKRGNISDTLLKLLELESLSSTYFVP